MGPGVKEWREERKVVCACELYYYIIDCKTENAINNGGGLVLHWTALTSCNCLDSKPRGGEFS